MISLSVNISKIADNPMMLAPLLAPVRTFMKIGSKEMVWKGPWNHGTSMTELLGALPSLLSCLCPHVTGLGCARSCVCQNGLTVYPRPKEGLPFLRKAYPHHVSRFVPRPFVKTWKDRTMRARRIDRRQLVSPRKFLVTKREISESEHISRFVV